MYKAIVFDWDETIVDSFYSIFEIHNAVALKLGFKKVGLKKFLTGWSKPWEVMVKTVWPGADFMKFKRHAFIERRKRKYKAIKGAVRVLNELSKKYELGLITNSHLKIVKLDALDIGFDLKVFKFKMTAEKSKFRKPDAREFDFVLKKFSKNEVLYVGDDLIDALFAKNAGVDFVAVLTGRTSKTEFKKLGVKNILGSVAELKDFLRTN
jgi:phosphoglycolate phosphatase